LVLRGLRGEHFEKLRAAKKRKHLRRNSTSQIDSAGSQSAQRDIARFGGQRPAPHLERMRANARRPIQGTLGNLPRQRRVVLRGVETGIVGDAPRVFHPREHVHKAGPGDHSFRTRSAKATAQKAQQVDLFVGVWGEIGMPSLG
jgi:hypothetical protein